MCITISLLVDGGTAQGACGRCCPEPRQVEDLSMRPFCRACMWLISSATGLLTQQSRVPSCVSGTGLEAAREPQLLRASWWHGVQPCVGGPLFPILSVCGSSPGDFGLHPLSRRWLLLPRFAPIFQGVTPFVLPF